MVKWNVYVFITLALFCVKRSPIVGYPMPFLYTITETGKPQSHELNTHVLKSMMPFLVENSSSRLLKRTYIAPYVNAQKKPSALSHRHWTELILPLLTKWKKNNPGQSVRLLSDRVMVQPLRRPLRPIRFFRARIPYKVYGR